jgi:hypothetical protein
LLTYVHFLEKLQHYYTSDKWKDKFYIQESEVLYAHFHAYLMEFDVASLNSITITTACLANFLSEKITFK